MTPLQAFRFLWERIFRLFRSMHISVTTLWTLGLISDTSLLLDDGVRDNSYDSAERIGSVSSHTAPLVFLGDCGAGKTSLSLTLRDHPLPKDEDPPKTLGLEETLIEVSYVDMSWREFGRCFLERMRNSEYIRALLYYVASAMNKQRQALRDNRSSGQVKMMLLETLLFNVLFIMMTQSTVSLSFGTILFICCGFYALVNRSGNIHFIMGYGSAIAIVSISDVLIRSRFFTLTDICLIELLASIFKHVLIVYLTSVLLGLGTGEGLSFAFSLFNSQKHIEMNVSLGCLCAFILMCHLVPLVKSRRWSYCFHFAIICILIVTTGLFIKHYEEMLRYISTGFLLSYTFVFGLECGQNYAPKLSVGGGRRIVITTMVGFLGGVFVTYFFEWSVKDHSWQTLSLSVMACVFIGWNLFGYHVYLTSKSHHVPVLQSLVDSSANPTKPARIAMIDCAGDEVYRDAQNIYMTSFAIFIIVFRASDIDDDNSNCDSTYHNLRKWLNVVAAHTQTHHLPRTYIVATHKATESRNISERQARFELLQQRLQHHYGHMLVSVPCRNAEDRIIVQIENRYRDVKDNKEDIERLQRSIIDRMDAEEIPLVWFHFLDIINDNAFRCRPEWPLPHLSELFSLVDHRCELHGNLSDFKQMLQHFNDSGDIFYDSKDSLLSSYVLLDRSILVDVIRCLVHRGQSVQQELQHKVNYELFEELSQCLGHLVPQARFHQLIYFLEALNFLIPMDLSQSKFLIPFNMPLWEAPPTSMINESSFDTFCEVDFDFKSYHPSSLFLRLLNLCCRLQITTGYSVEEFAQLFRNQGCFRHDPLKYIVYLNAESPFVISLRIIGEASVREIEVQRKAASLLHQFSCFISHLCMNHFTWVNYVQEIKCTSCAVRSEMRRSETDTLPFRWPDRFECPCGTILVHRASSPEPTQVIISSKSDDQFVSFRFATDLLILCHETPPDQLLSTLRRLLNNKCRKPIQMWSDICSKSSTCKTHMQEACVVLVLVSVRLNACRQCQQKIETLWRRKMEKGDQVTVIPIMMEENVRNPELLRHLKSLQLSDVLDDDDDDRFQNALTCAFKQYGNL